jgi:uncharacterized protein GlcG (DUF336 family)
MPLFAAGLVVLFCPSFSFADELPKESVMPLAMASKAAQAAIEACKKDGYRVSASVVDRAGVLRTMGRADGAGSHTVESSRKKAYTAASLRRATTELAELIGKVPTLQSLREMNDEILILGGGLPIEIGGDVVGGAVIAARTAMRPTDKTRDVVGGIGVGGAPGAHLDDACAQAGLDAVGAAPKVPPVK